MGQIQRGEEARNLDIDYIFCKQIFGPWENLDDDPVAIDLIYDQIINGISDRSVEKENLNGSFRNSSEYLSIRTGHRSI